MPETLVQIGRRARIGTPPPPGRREPRPEWLRIRLQTPERYQKVKRLIDDLSLNTVCTEARCPNIYECWGEHGTATFMILGDTCTRRCGFCSVHSGRPAPGVDAGSPSGWPRRWR
jgi:lipoyl synthase